MEDMIWCQKAIPKEQWRYGLRSSAATGCGWIATYNALRLMGYRAEPEKLIRYYQRRFPVVNGNFGTFIFNLVAFFRERGFPVTLTARWNKLDGAARGADACILARPYVTALYGGGAEGVKILTDKVKAELEDTMAMCGVHSLAEISRDNLY